MFVLLLLLSAASDFAMSGSCPTGTITGVNSKCYKVYSEHLNFFVADSVCTTGGGQLASVASAFENAFLSRMSTVSIEMSA